MNREILFRGKNDAGEWLYGYLTKPAGNPCFIIDGDDYFGGVIEETIGQYTGLTDKNGTKIFEGDIVEVWQRNCYKMDEKKYKAVVEFGNPNCTYDWGWQLKFLEHFIYNKSILLWVEMQDVGVYCEVVGNIHDNPELLEGL